MSKSILIQIETDDGIIGWGEFVINRWKTKNLLAKLCSNLVGKSVNDVVCSTLLPFTYIDAFDEWVVGFDRRRRIIREGFSIALYDILGKSVDKPFYKLLSSKNRRNVSGMPVIHVFKQDVRLEILKKWEQQGYQYFKLKLTQNVDADIKMLDHLLKYKDPHSKVLIVDLNYGYKAEQDLLKLIKYVKNNGIDYIQNPLRTSLTHLSKIQKTQGVKFTADNTAWWPNTKRIIDKQAASLINLHPNIQGGIDTMYKSVCYANQAGVKSIIGASGNFGIQNFAYIGMSALLENELPCEEICLDPYYHCSTEHYYFSDLPTVLKTPLKIEDGVISIPEGPGLGIDVDIELVKNFTVWTQIYNA